MKWFLLIEDGRKFAIPAWDLEQAKDAAQMWNAEVIRECTTEEADALDNLNHREEGD